MSDEATDRDVEALADVLAAAERAAPFDFDAVGWKRRHDYQAEALLNSDWYAERIAEARREGAAEALKAAANRVAVATTPHSATFDAYMHASQIVRETALRSDA